TTLFRSLRGSVLLGFVGVSGIGMYISAALETMNYPRGMGLTLVLLVLCLLAELGSGLLRRQMLGARGTVAGAPGPVGRWFAALLPQRTGRGWVRGEPVAHTAPRTRTGEVRLSPPWDAARRTSTGRQILRCGGIAVSLLVFRSPPVSQAGVLSPVRLGHGM